MREAQEPAASSDAKNAAFAASARNSASKTATTNPTGKAPRNVVLVDPKDKKNGREIAIAVLCVAVTVLILLLCLRFFACSSDVYDPNAKEGMLPTKTDEEIQEEMNRQIEEGMFAISIYSVIRFPDGSSEGVANIENVPNNNFDMQVTITEDSTGDVLYESGVIKPNSYVDKIRLSEDLDAGTYNATATFHALDRKTHKESGIANAKVAIYVES